MERIELEDLTADRVWLEGGFVGGEAFEFSLPGFGKMYLEVCK